MTDELDANEAVRAYKRAYYAVNYKGSPEHKAKTHERYMARKAKIDADPELKEKLAEKARAYREKIKDQIIASQKKYAAKRKERYLTDPEYREREKARMREKWRKEQARKLAQRAANPPPPKRVPTEEERAERARRQREARAARERQKRMLARQQREAEKAAAPPPPPPAKTPRRSMPKYGGIIARMIWHGGKL